MEVCREGETPWFFTAVYANPNETLRQELWAELSSFGCHCDSPWLLAGDFNETKNMQERFNYSEDLSRRCNNFNLWIEINHLLDLGFSGPRYTRTRGQSLEIKKYTRLDRGLCNEQWRVIFEEACVHHLLQNKSDDRPLLISPNGFTSVQGVMRPFRFQAAWLSHELFEDYLRDNWKQNIPLYPLLSHMAKALDDWNKQMFGNLFLKKKETMG